MTNQKLAEELHKTITIRFEKRKDLGRWSCRYAIDK